ncbi:ABC transporter ATP-binding protein [Salipiger sp. P9]|uniref:ABC transporter ATP-binding protein n=1 Tax=Salipiger pentaromativorans TaxID=2943193 RepID=UPI002157E456|nr:ABC transporter ATP-binding protein [Salipiger pentaromativorans]MCR8548841.1 ABC transporter ATP-binding protein [Salipiger pentaromativorans]
MAEITLETLGHRYAPGLPYALRPFSMTWQDGGTYALLGPSGCGKSTMLNIISGLLRPSDGRVLFDGVDVTERDTGKRNIAQVFQVPVIYRSMTVAENLGFPLVCRGVPAARIRRRVDSIAERLGLARHLKRPAHALSADQKQLVSLGRGLVREDVAAILLDEPLTVIDPQLKFELRRILKEINEEFRLTTVLVTHDQTEAMTFAKEVIVMNLGEVVQAGAPRALFERPATEHVGWFIGSPAMNFLPARQESGRVTVPGTTLSAAAPEGLGEGRLSLGFRPEHARVVSESPQVAGQVERIWFEGSDEVVALRAEALTLRVRLPGGRVLATGDRLGISVPPENLLIYRDGRLVA